MKNWYDEFWRKFYSQDRIVKFYASRFNILHLVKGGRAQFLDACCQYLDLPPEGRIIDMCCGTGDFARALAERLDPKTEVFGIDLSREMIKRATMQSHTNTLCFDTMDAIETTFRRENFDAVTVVAALHEMPYEIRRALLEEAHRILKPKGTLLVGEHFVSGRWWASLFQRLIFWMIAQKPERRTFADLARRGLENEIRAVGFVVLARKMLRWNLFQLVYAQKPETH